MNLRKRTTNLAALVAGLLAGAVAAEERIDRTGSRVGGDATGRMVVRFSEPREVGRVLELLDAGRTDEALALAEDYLASLGSVIHVGQSSAASERYFALNALCAARTKARLLEDAVAACSEAIEVRPGRWTALNNRGTAYFMLGRYEDALADYRRALDVAPRREYARTTIEHNIALSLDRLPPP